MFQVVGPTTDGNLLTVSRALGQLLVDGVHTAPVTSAYYSQVAAAMIQADQARNQGRYSAVLSSAFFQRGILSTAAAASLANAPLPRREVPSAGISSTTGFPGSRAVGGSVSSLQTRLVYDGSEDDGYKRGPEDVPALPVQTVTTEFGMVLLAHAPIEPARFSVVPAVLGGTSAELLTSDEVARGFVEDLIQSDRLDLRAAQGRVALIATPDTRLRAKTHVVRETPQGFVLKRLHFDCRCCCG
jgi:hypothetical protein